MRIVLERKEKRGRRGGVRGARFEVRAVATRQPGVIIAW